MKNLKIYSLNKSRHILKNSYKNYKKKRHQLNPLQLLQYETLLQDLDDSFLKGDRIEASRLAHKLENFNDLYFKKSFSDYIIELAVAVVIALVVATIVRQCWFEPYEIPTGSMRPTFKEQDHLTVSKTAFGINIPLTTGHFYFEPSHVQRTGIVIWTGENVPHLDSDSTFMGIFPYTKRYIKRCMGKPGDTLYFYGGKIFGFDRDGNDLVELRENPWTATLDHVPFTRYEGRETYKQQHGKNESAQIFYHHFNQLIGRYHFSRQGFTGEIFNGKEWIKDQPDAQKTPHNAIKTYSDFWGMRNYAIARLLTPKQVTDYTSFDLKELDEAKLYLELRHTPSLSYPLPLIHPKGAAMISGYSAIIPLQEKHILALRSHLYTCRFLISNEYASSYNVNQAPGLLNLMTLKELVNSIAGKQVWPIAGKKPTQYQPFFKDVPNGSYEFYYGRGDKVGWGAITSPIKADNPLVDKDISTIQKLYNIGIEMSTFFEPQVKDQLYFPNRYVYFRNGDLYTMGGIIIEKNDSTLKTFNQRESKREADSTTKKPYVAFKDYGAPFKEDGSLDKEFIKTFGLTIPEKNYLMLGDNHAMSQDSRYFGCIPEDNLQGVPSLILWPPGERFGIPNQKPYPLISISRLIVWTIAAIVLAIWAILHRLNRKKRVFKKLN